MTAHSIEKQIVSASSDERPGPPADASQPVADAFVVDDEEGICRFVSFALGNLGLKAESYPTAAQAITALERGHPEIVFLDIALEGSDAVDVLRALGEKRYSGVVQVMSGSNTDLLDDVRRETILVVEDDAAVRAVAVATLEGVGYRVQQAPDGRAALAILRQPGLIDLLFTDLVMPNGVGGQDLLRMARECRPDLKAIFTSGYSEQFIRGREQTDKDVPLLPKPYRRQKLLDVVRRVFDAAG